MKNKFLSCWIMLGLAVVAHGADVEVVKTGAEKIPIDLSGLAVAGGASQLFLKTLENDLTLSGWFSVTGKGGSVLGVSGSCVLQGDSLRVECRVRNSATGTEHLAKHYGETAARARKLAHRVADDILLAVKGVRGIASTRILMVGSVNGRKDIYLCDADGRDLERITSDGVPCLSPSWGPQGDIFVYTSFVGGFPDVYLVNLSAKSRRKAVGFPGLNAGANVSPDGKRLALTLSKDGNPDLYLVDLQGNSPFRLTRTRHAAEASASWSPDGRRLVFVSDQTGRPHLYVMDRDGGNQKRLTFRGTENVAPDWGPHGEVVYSSKRGAHYQLCLLNANGVEDRQLTSAAMDHEEPSWAPNGRHVAFTRTEGYRANVYILDTMEDAPVRLTTQQGDWYAPAWSPR